MWDQDTLYADRYSKDEQLLMHHFCVKQKYEYGW
jgi:hypothetical protein